MHQDITTYNHSQSQEYKVICQKLAGIIQANLPGSTNKVWHAHPVWFIDDNPIVGYSVQKKGVRLMFWSGRSYNDDELVAASKFKDASIFYCRLDDINENKIKRWLELSERIQWDYKHIVARKGHLEKLTNF